MLPRGSIQRISTATSSGSTPGNARKFIARTKLIVFATEFFFHGGED
jgi:hypothetical protein